MNITKKSDARMPSLTSGINQPMQNVPETPENLLKSVILQLYSNMVELTQNDVRVETVAGAVGAAREIRELLRLNAEMKISKSRK